VVVQSKFSLTEGSIPRALLAFSLPILFGNVLQSVNGSINAVWVGKYLGEAAFAAVGNSNVVMFLMFGVMFGFTMATTVMVAQCVGAKNVAEAKRVVGTAAYMRIIFLAYPFMGGLFFVMAVLRGAGDSPALGLFLPANGAAIEIASRLNAVILWSFALFAMALGYYRFGGWRNMRLGIAEAVAVPTA
jgi:Na+-driven multidrug efflux pump